MARTDTLNNFCTDIADSIREQTGETGRILASEFDTKIKSITRGEGSSDEWQPQPDWWDIDSILENDTEDYPAKIIFLLSDAANITNFQSLKATKIVCSDGTTYEPNDTIVWYDHVWDITKDKKCSLGYKTRYIIFYFTNTVVDVGNIKLCGSKYASLHQILYGVVKGFTNFKSRYILDGLCNLEMMKYIDTINGADMLVIGNCNKLIDIIGYKNNNLQHIHGGSLFSFKGFESIDYSNVIGVNNLYNNVKHINKLVFPSTLDLSKVQNYYGVFNNFGGTIIEKIDFTSCTTTSNLINTNNNTILIEQILGELKVSTNISQASVLNHDTLMRFINCLYDYASEGSTDIYQLIIGPTNIAKLSDEEKAIATNKGWTLN